MAVTEQNSTQRAKLILPSPGIIKARNNGGRVRCYTDAGLFAAGSEVNSTITFGKMSTSALLLSSSRVLSDALGANTTLDFGFVNNTLAGVSSKTAALIAAGAVGASAASLSALAAVNITYTGKPIWEILGLSADPKMDLDMIVTLKGATSSAGGDVALDLQFVLD